MLRLLVVGGSTRQKPTLRRPKALTLFAFDLGERPAGALRGAEREDWPRIGRAGVMNSELLLRAFAGVFTGKAGLVKMWMLSVVS